MEHRSAPGPDDDAQPSREESGDDATAPRGGRGDDEQLSRETVIGFALLVLLVVVFIAGMWALSTIIYSDGSPREPESRGDGPAVSVLEP